MQKRERLTKRLKWFDADLMVLIKLEERGINDLRQSCQSYFIVKN